MPVRAFLFDLDGTIWDSKKAILETLYEAFSEKNSEQTRSLPEVELEKYGSPIGVLRVYKMSESRYWRLYRRNIPKIHLFFDNTRDVFTALRMGGKCVGFITSLKKGITIELLTKFNLRKYADVLITPSECRITKPSPRPLFMALRHLGLTGHDALYIGNEERDVIAARSAGCMSGIARWGVSGTIREKPDYIFEVLEDILNLI